jgi:hypothetical protein
MIQLPVTDARRSTWKWYRDAAGISMGRAIMALVDRELVSAVGESAGEGPPVLRSKLKSSWQLESHTSSLVSVLSRRLRSGCAGGASGYVAGRENSRPRGSQPSWRPSWLLDRGRPARRSAATNGAPAGQVPSTSMPRPNRSIAHSAGYVGVNGLENKTGPGPVRISSHIERSYVSTSSSRVLLAKPSLVA